jgi:hypothetical protein
VFFASAQEDIFSDSISKKHPELLVKQPSMERSLMLDATTFPIEINTLNYSIFDQPLLPLQNKNLDFLKYLNPSKQNNLSYSFSGTSFNPVYPFGTIFNQSIYRLNDRLMIGGNSFGAQSVFDPPKLNSSIQDMSIKGASMFMQYKVSDHFKVETRVSISNGRSTPWEP